MLKAELPMFEPVVGTAKAATRWWIDELRGLAPVSLTGAQRTGNRLIVDLDRTGAQLLSEKGREISPLAPAAGRTGIGDACARLARRPAGIPVGIRLSMADCYVRHAMLPEAARSDFSRILHLQLERITPFKPQDVYEAHCEVGAGTEPGTLDVLHLVAKRSLVEPVLRNCAEHGVQVAFIDCWDESRSAPLPIDFLAAGQPAARRSTAVWLGAIAAVLLVTAVVADILKQDAALARLTAETTTLREKVRGAQRIVEAKGAAAQEIERVIAARLARPAVTEIVDELTRILPDSAVLQHLRIERAAIDLSGTTASAVALLPLLEQSKLFHDARLTAPVSVDAKDGRERFGIRLQLRGRSKAAVGPKPGERG